MSIPTLLSIYKCSICHKHLSTKYRLKTHFQTHTPKDERFRPFQCIADGCTNAFFSRQDRKRHIESRHPSSEGRFKCDRCSKRFHRSSTLKRHLVIADEKGSCEKLLPANRRRRTFTDTADVDLSAFHVESLSRPFFDPLHTGLYTTTMEQRVPTTYETFSIPTNVYRVDPPLVGQFLTSEERKQLTTFQGKLNTDLIPKLLDANNGRGRQMVASEIMFRVVETSLDDELVALNMMEFLLQAGADPNFRSKMCVKEQDCSMLKTSLRLKMWRLSRLLLGAGSSVHDACNCSRRPGEYGIASPLQQACDMEVPTDIRNTILTMATDAADISKALVIATADSRIETMSLLIDKKGADLLGVYGCVGTALHKACSDHQLGAMNLLLNRGADPSAKDADGKTPLHALLGYFSGSCCSTGKALEMLEILLSHNVDVNASNSYDTRPMELLLSSHPWEVAEDEIGDFPYGLLKRLFQAGASLDIRGQYGGNALHLFAEWLPLYDERRVFIDTLKLLLENGADASLKDERGKRPQDILDDALFGKSAICIDQPSVMLKNYRTAYRLLSEASSTHLDTSSEPFSDADIDSDSESLFA